jgi:hypothetical protein
VRRDAIEKPNLQQAHPHDGQRFGLYSSKVATAETLQLVVEPCPPCNGSQHQPGRQPAIGGWESWNAGTEHGIGVTSAALHRHQDF